ncbi:hypothetical protein ACI2K4_09955 [Micromonospora sp. NPDC050397]
MSGPAVILVLTGLGTAALAAFGYLRLRAWFRSVWQGERWG